MKTLKSFRAFGAVLTFSSVVLIILSALNITGRINISTEFIRFDAGGIVFFLITGSIYLVITLWLDMRVRLLEVSKHVRKIKAQECFLHDIYSRVNDLTEETDFCLYRILSGSGAYSYCLDGSGQTSGPVSSLEEIVKFLHEYMAEEDYDKISVSFTPPCQSKFELSEEGKSLLRLPLMDKEKEEFLAIFTKKYTLKNSHE